MDDKDPNRKRGAASEKPTTPDGVQGGAAYEVGTLVHQVESLGNAAAVVPPSPSAKRDPKHTNSSSSGETKDDNTSTNSSSVGHRRER